MLVRLRIYKASRVVADPMFLLKDYSLYQLYRVGLILCTSTSSMLLRNFLLTHIPPFQIHDLFLLLAIAQADDSPSAAPGPLSSTTVAATAFHGPKLLVFALRQADNNVCLDSTERENA
jgi:hypothetical protein